MNLYNTPISSKVSEISIHILTMNQNNYLDLQSTWVNKTLKIEKYNVCIAKCVQSGHKRVYFSIQFKKKKSTYFMLLLQIFVYILQNLGVV